MYDDFNQAGSKIAISLSLVKYVSSAGRVIYNASIFGPPSLSPPTRNTRFVGLLQQRTIAITLRPMVNVVTNSPKNILTLLGSLAGIFPLIASIGGIVASMMWSKFGPQNTSLEGGKSALELNVVKVAISNDASQIERRAASEIQVPSATNSGQQVEAGVELNGNKVQYPMTPASHDSTASLTGSV